jgi:glycosyltransferase involved in cell wall biosynthesis
MYCLSNQDRRVIFLTNDVNLGGSLSRNRGIEIAKGEYITFLDDDDEYLPYKIEHQVEFMMKEDCDLSFTNMVMYSEKNKIVDSREYDDLVTFSNDFLLKYHLMKHLTGTPTFMYKSPAIKKIGGFEDVKMGQEFILMLKSIERNLSIRYYPICDVKIYKHTDGGISQGINKILGENELFKFKKKYFPKLGKDEIRFILFRHQAVMVVAYFRNNNFLKALLAALFAFLSSPILFIQQVSAFIVKLICLNKEREHDSFSENKK